MYYENHTIPSVRALPDKMKRDVKSKTPHLHISYSAKITIIRTLGISYPKNGIYHTEEQRKLLLSNRHAHHRLLG